MPATSSNQATAARIALAAKKGEIPTSKLKGASKQMAKGMTRTQLRHFTVIKDELNVSQKKRLLDALRHLKESNGDGMGNGGNIGGETDIACADNLMVNEDGITGQLDKIKAKTFNTKGDFDSYVQQHRGIELTSKEKEAAIAYHVKPNNFSEVKNPNGKVFALEYESVDDFQNNEKTVIKKLKEGKEFCWTAFYVAQQAGEEGKPEEKEPAANNQPEINVGNTIQITKTITFVDDIQGANILSKLLQQLDL